jgi:hypothetical protein
METKLKTLLVPVAGGTAEIEIVLDTASLERLATVAAYSRAGTAVRAPLTARVLRFPTVTQTIAQAIENRGGKVEEVLLEADWEKARRLPVCRAKALGIEDLAQVVAGAKSWHEARSRVERSVLHSAGQARSGVTDPPKEFHRPDTCQSGQASDPTGERADTRNHS